MTDAKAEREAIDAAKLYLQGIGPWKLDDIGICYDDPLVQAFARHAHDARMAERELLQAENERLREELELARNRLQRVALELPSGSGERYECFKWADEITAALTERQ